MKIKLTGDHETVISRTIVGGKDCWLAFSDVPHDIARFRKMGWTQRYVNEDGSAEFISYEESAINIANANGRKKRQFTAEQLEELRHRFH